MVYVSHRLDEIFRIADRVTVMRDGRRVATLPVAETSPAELVQLIVGRTPIHVAARKPPARRRAALRRRAAHGHEDAGSHRLHPPARGDRGVRRPARGRAGAGRPRASAASCPVPPAHCSLAGRTIAPRTPADAVGLGIAFVSSKRQEESLAMPLAVRENLFINPAVEGRGALPRPPRRTRRHPRAGPAARRRRPPARHRARHRDLQRRQPAEGRAVPLARRRHVGARAGGADHGRRRRRQGGHLRPAGPPRSFRCGGVIVVSTDFEEVAAICHRALIFDRGLIAGELSGDALTPGRPHRRMRRQHAKARRSPSGDHAAWLTNHLNTAAPPSSCWPTTRCCC